MNEYQEIQIAIKVIEKYFKKYDQKVEYSMNVNLDASYGDELDNNAIIDTIKGLNVLIALEDILKELKTIASELDKTKDN